MKTLLLAQSTGVDIGKTFFGPNSKGFTEQGQVGSIVSIIVANAMVIAGIILLIFLIGAGISMISGAGQNNPEKMEKGKKAATSALIGFVIVFAAYWIVQLIGKITGVNILGN